MICLSELYEGVQKITPVSQPEFEKEFDVIVCGVGTAGSLAALFCAQNGLSVLGVEAANCPGGTHTIGGIGGHYFGCPGGLYLEMEDKIAAFTQQYAFVNTESRKYLLEQALTEQGVELLYSATVCGVYLDNRTVIGVRVLTEQGMASYKAKIVMDCTAEACVAVIAGCETECGRETDGQMQPYSVVSLVYDNGRYHHTNVDFGRVDQYQDADLSRAVLFSRSNPIAEGMEGCQCVTQMPMLGIREGRRILSEENITLPDIFADRFTDTPMFYSYADLDKHGWDIAFDGETIGDWAIGANLGAYNVTVPVSYKSLLPKDFDGILVPCRALGVDRDISSCVRMNPDMEKAAECAAHWASLAIHQSLSLRDVPYSQLKERLTATGCLKEEDNRGYRIDGKRNWDGGPLTPSDVHWITDPAMLEASLKTEKPGEAIWSAKRMGAKALPTLQKLISSPDENVRKHAAFALAILENRNGIPVLRDMVTSRDSLMLKDCRKHNNLRGCMAIYWLGRLADREITSELIQMICDPEEIQNPIYHQPGLQTTRYPISDFNNLYFQYLSQAVMALIRIGNAHPDLQSTIGDAFTRGFSDDAFYHRTTKRPRQSSEGNMTLALKHITFSTIQRWQNS